jgi:hypothetical protein
MGDIEKRMDKVFKANGVLRKSEIEREIVYNEDQNFERVILEES